MARIRTIKPSFFTSPDMAELPIGTRLTFIGLWTHVDDHGRCADDSRIIKGHLWPLDDAYTSKKVEADLVLLAKKGHIERYTVADRHYLRVVKWHHQRVSHPTDSTIPAPPVRANGSHALANISTGGREIVARLPESLAEPPESLAEPPETFAPEVEVEVEGEQGSGSISSSSPLKLTTGAPELVDDDDRTPVEAPEATPWRSEATVWELTAAVAIDRLARGDLERRTTERGPVGDEASWLVRARETRMARHAKALQRLDLASFVGRVDVLVATLDPPRHAGGGGPLRQSLTSTEATQQAGRSLQEQHDKRRSNPCPECHGERFVSVDGEPDLMTQCPTCLGTGVDRG